MSKSKLSLICLAILLALPSMAFAQRGSKGALPVVSSIAPTSATAGGPGFALTVGGSNFSNGSIVLWNGNSLSTTFVSATQLHATIPGGLIAAAGVAQVAVYTPGRSGGTSNLVAFTISPAATTTTTTTSTGAPLAITTTSLPVGTAGTAYSQTLAASGGTSPYAWSVTSGAVPPGLTLSSAGAVSGTPTTAGSYSFMAQVQDSASATSSLIYSVSIGAAATSPLAVSTVSVPGGTAGTAYGTNLAATGGTAPYTWSVAAGSSLPPGLALSAAGAISGTPDMPATYPFSVQVRDSVNNTSTMAYSLAIVAPAPTAPTTPACNSPYGNCSDPYEGKGGPPATRTAISACGTYTPTTGQYLYVPASIGTDPTLACITLNYSSNSGWTLDLGGNTVTGGISVLAGMNGATIFNGTITCSIAAPSACLHMGPDNRIVSQCRIHHLTINQLYTGSGQAYAIVGSAPSNVYSGGGSGAGKAVRIDHISAVMSGSPDGVTTRRPIIYISGGSIPGQSFQIDDNALTCPSNAWSCWAISYFNISDTLTDHNFILMNPYDVYHSYGTGIQWESGNYTGATNAEIAYNTIIVNNHRGIRFWGYAPGGFTGLFIHDNYLQQINLRNRFGAVHLGETNGFTDFQNAQVYSNTFDMVGGHGVVVASGQGVTIHDNAVMCSTGCVAGYYFAVSDVISATTNNSIMTVSNNNVTALTSSGLPAVMVCGPPGINAYHCAINTTTTSSATVSNSGTVVGNGTIQ